MVVVGGGGYKKPSPSTRTALFMQIIRCLRCNQRWGGHRAATDEGMREEEGWEHLYSLGTAASMTVTRLRPSFTLLFSQKQKLRFRR